MKYLDAYAGPEADFWELFPVQKTIGLTKALYKADRSKGKNKSSKVMWWIVLAKDVDSDLYSFSYEEQKETLDIDIIDAEAVCEDLKIDMEALMEFFVKCADTVITGSIRRIEAKYNEKVDYFMALDYDKANAKFIDSSIISADVIASQIQNMRAKYIAEQDTLYGGGTTGGNE